MTPRECPEDQIRVELLGTQWFVIQHNTSVEHFDKFAPAVARAVEPFQAQIHRKKHVHIEPPSACGHSTERFPAERSLQTTRTAEGALGEMIGTSRMPAPSSRTSRRSRQESRRRAARAVASRLDEPPPRAFAHGLSNTE
jgi:hypothetical protein